MEPKPKYIKKQGNQGWTIINTVPWITHTVQMFNQSPYWFLYTSETKIEPRLIQYQVTMENIILIVNGNSKQYSKALSYENDDDKRSYKALSWAFG